MVLVNLGTTYLKQERFPPAERVLELATKTDPTLAPAYCRLAYCYYRQRRYQQAIDTYGHSLELDETMADAHAGLGVVYMTMYLLDSSAAKHYEKAIESWHRSLELNPDQPVLKRLLAKYNRHQTAPPGLLSGN